MTVRKAAIEDMEQKEVRELLISWINKDIG